MAHANPAPGQGSYAASKAAAASLFQHLAEEIPSKIAQIINIHPGAILTQAAHAAGYTEDAAPWDDGKLVPLLSPSRFRYCPVPLESLPGDFSVWASTAAAKFLHGRFVWTSWDVDELMHRQDEIAGQEGMLKIGLQGVDFITVPQLFARVLEKTPTNK